MIVPRYTREIPHRYRLEAGRCTGCGYLAFPRRAVCPECGGREFEKTNLSPDGKLLSWTVCHVAADYFSTQTPFAVGVIETSDGGRLTAQIVDCDPDGLEVGQAVRLMVRCVQREGEAGVLEYGYKAVPV